MSQYAFRQYCLIGSGRLARHLSHYLSLIDLPVVQWSRAQDPNWIDLPHAVASASHVLIAVSDSAIAEMAGPLRGSGKVLVHFSGAMSVPGVVAAHPLMTFGEELKDLNWYRQIPFAVDPGQKLSDILPGFPNRSVNLDPECKALYHALCVLAGNYTHLLWRKIASEFEVMGLPRDILKPYLHQVVENALANESRTSADAISPRDLNFTGPVAREDWQVVRGHLRALARRADLLDAYSAFLRLASSTGIDLPKDMNA